MRLKIGPRYYDVMYALDLVVDGEKAFGCLEHTTRQISVDASLDSFERASTILHEALHVMDDNYGLEMGEAGVQALETLLTSLLQENPEFTRELVDACLPAVPEEPEVPKDGPSFLVRFGDPKPYDGSDSA